MSMIAILTFIVGFNFGFFIYSLLAISKGESTNAENEELNND
nr:MAG TPA: Protein of unknown function (DUF1043) [Bacteriophage sp.]